MPTPEDLCGICHLARAWHEEHRPKHKFSEPESDPTLQQDPPPQQVDQEAKEARLKLEQRANQEQEKRLQSWNQEPGRIQVQPEPPRVTFPSDMVLRLALVEKGILTPEDLDQAEAKLQAISGGGSVLHFPGNIHSSVHLVDPPTPN